MMRRSGRHFAEEHHAAQRKLERDAFNLKSSRSRKESGMDSTSSHPALIQVAGAGDREAHGGGQRLDDRNGETSLEGAGRRGERPAADDDGLSAVVADGLLAGGGEGLLETARIGHHFVRLTMSQAHAAEQVAVTIG